MKRLDAGLVLVSCCIGLAACAQGGAEEGDTLDPTFGDQGNDEVGTTDDSTTGDGDTGTTTGTTETDGGTDESTDTTDTGTDGGAVCGNGLLEDGEECDGGDLGDKTCQGEGFGGGGLVCTEDCTIDTSNCTNCGNDVVDEDEECDGEDLGGNATCADLNLGGADEELGCTAMCEYDFGLCSGCGDGMVTDPEQCEPPGELLDKADLNGETCMSQGFDDGLLDCTAGCTFNTDSCYICGDAVQQGQEECDGADFGGKACGDFIAGNGDPFESGSLSCEDTCLIDTANCSLCGDGVVTGAEVCEPGVLNGETCESVNASFDGGQLACKADCSGYDTSACTDCGDGVIEGNEGCDFNNLGGETCESQGFPGGGTLGCSLECVLDTSQCNDNFCGDGQVNGGDQCDCGNQGQNCTASQLGNESCASLGFDGGVLACNSPNNCSYDTSGCYECGDDKIDPGEQCDGVDLGGETCVSQGFPGGGTLGCGASCGYDTSQCLNVQNPFTLCVSPNLGIVDNSSVISTINVPDSASITDVDVYVDALHTWVGDVDITLSHNATTRTVIDRPGVPNTTFGCSDDNIDASFSDEGAGDGENTCLGTPPNSAAILSPPDYVPTQAFSAFDGQDMSGDWDLTITDNVGGDSGTLLQWCVTISWQ